MAAPPSSVTPRRLSIGLYVLTLALLAGGGALAAGALRSSGPQAPLKASLTLPPASQAGPASGGASVDVYQALAASPVFGTPPAPAAPPAQQQAAPETPVNAVVVGVFLVGKAYRAVVEVGSTGQKLLKVGDPLGGGRIAEITLTEVVLERNGRRITLPVSPSGRARPAPAPVRVPAAPQRSVALRPAEPAGSAESDYGGTNIDTGDIELKDFDSFYSGLKSGLLGAKAKTTHDVAGKPVGLAFDDVPRGALLWRMGLRPGDIVTDVNDIPVTDMNSLLNAFDKVAAKVRSEDESFIVVDLVRDQKPDAVILTIW